MNSETSAEAYNPFHNQNFYSIRDWLLRRGYLFEDPYFKINSKYEWLRPWEITNNPQLFVGGITRFDINQGELGDCWMLASIAALANHPNLVKKNIPLDQSFTSQYAGIFHFRFWRFGKWIDVVIDDRLPTKNRKLVFTKSLSENEFWTPLMEKAYCKVLGGDYQAADAGNLCEGLEDFTGGVVEQYLLRSVPRNFQNALLRSAQRSSLIGCFIDDIPGQIETRDATGLVKGHSYSVTDVKYVNLPGHGSIVLVRVRNPWGKHEWNGPWSDGSAEWRSVPDSIKRDLGLVYRDDGEFWMSYTDFVTYFQWLDMCHLGPNAYIDAYGRDSNITSWQLNMIRGSWVRGVTTGGAADLSKNPQIKFTLSEADDDNHDGLCSVLIVLMQRSNRGDNYEIGFQIYELDDPNEAYLDRHFFINKRSVVDVKSKMVREVGGRYNLPPGYYCIVPFTYSPGLERDFLVRIYSEKNTDINEMDSKIGLSPADVANFVKPPVTVGIEPKDEKFVDDFKVFFESVANEDNEVDWKELKIVLDSAINETSKNSGIGHLIFDALTQVYNKIFGINQAADAFKTVSPGGFSNDLCRSFVALLDVDHSGKLGYNEFQDLWHGIKNWQSVYEQFSHKDGYLGVTGLNEALESSGYSINKKTMKDIVRRYSEKDGKINFDDFLHLVVKLKTMVDFFRSKEMNDTHNALFTLEEFLAKTLYS